MWILPYVSATLGLISVGMFIRAIFLPDTTATARLSAALQENAPAGAVPHSPPPLLSEGADLTEGVSRLTRQLALLDRLQIQLLRAGWVVRPSEFLIFASLGAVAAAALLMFVSRSWWMGIPGLLVGYGSAWVMLQSRQTARNRTLSAQLPDALDMLCSSLRAGFSVGQAMHRVQTQCTPPISEEFGRAIEEIRFGRSLSVALETMVIRTANYDLALVVSAIQTQLETGGNMAEVLAKIATMIRERVRLKGEVAIASAEGRLSAAILLAMPFVMGFAIRFMNPSYLNPLVTTPEGKVMLVIGISLMLLGAWVLNKLTSIEV